MSKVLVIDNYDSFTFNLVHLIGRSATRSRWRATMRCRWPTSARRRRTRWFCRRDPAARTRRGSASMWCANWRVRFRSSASASGFRPSGRPSGAMWCARLFPCTARSRPFRHGAKGLFRGINESFEATRYHSLVVDRATCPASLSVTAEADGLIMGLEHASFRSTGCSSIPRASARSTGARSCRTSSNWRGPGMQDVTGPPPTCIDAAIPASRDDSDG